MDKTKELNIFDHFSKSNAVLFEDVTLLLVDHLFIKMNYRQHGVHNELAVSGFMRTLLGIFYQLPADSFSLISGVYRHLHQADFFIVDRSKD